MRLLWLWVATLLPAPVCACAADPSALWKIVDGQCVPHEQAAHDPSPCALVEIAGGVEKGFAVLKDINGAFQFLLIPTARIGGIEDPAILAPGAENYWEAAWQSRHFMEQRLGAAVPRDMISLAINSMVGRTQDQLHIHIDCVRPDVHDALTANLDRITDVWTPFPVTLAGEDYRAVRIDQETLEGIDPFRVLADAGSPVAGGMGMHTLVVVGATFPDGGRGFVLLDNQAELPMDRASGEQLQDHGCAIAGK
jgi:CDP-diacylglycerol pyrophosphatase